jgi:hypothetical protein
MAKQIKEIHFIFKGDETAITDLGINYKVQDTVDTDLVKEGTVTITWNDTHTVDAIHGLAKTAIEAAEGI